MTPIFKSKVFPPLRNNRGSAIVPVLIGFALLTVFIYAAMNLQTNLNKDVKRSQSSEAAESLSQTISLLVSDPEVCLAGVDGAGPQQGLVFEDSGGAVSVFNLALAASTTGQNIRLGSNLSGGSLVLVSGVAIPSLDLKVNQLYLKSNGVQVVGKPLNTYLGQIYLSATQISTGSSLGVRKAADVIFQTDPTLFTLLGCASAAGAQQVCEGMGCTYLPAALDKKCQCKMADMSCPAGQYVDGYNAALAPTCKSIEFTCNPLIPAPGAGPGYFMTGIDRLGRPICVAMVKLAGCTAQFLSWSIGADTCSASFPAQAASSVSGLMTDATAPTTGTAAFACTAAGTWAPNPLAGATCSTGVLCSGGATTTPSLALASPAGCFCLMSETWDSGACRTYVGGIWALKVSIIPTWPTQIISGAAVDAMCAAPPVVGATCPVKDVSCIIPGGGVSGGPRACWSGSGICMGAISSTAFFTCEALPGNLANGQYILVAPACAGNIGNVVAEPTCASGSAYCSGPFLISICAPPTVLTDSYTPGAPYNACSGRTPITHDVVSTTGTYNTSAGVETCAEAHMALDYSCSPGYTVQYPLRHDLTRYAPEDTAVYSCVPCGAGSRPPATCL